MELKKNQEYVVEIIDNGIGGDGIARIDNNVVFVKGALTGEKVKIKIIKVLSSYSYGKIEKIIEKSINRCATDCMSYQSCGGCTLRHIKYYETLRIKENNIKTVLKKQGLEDIKVNSCIGMEKPKYYRNKLQCPFGFDSNGNAVMGIFKERSHHVVNIEKCMIQNELIQAIANDVFKYITENNISIYNEKNHVGSIRHIVIRIGIKTNEVMLTLVVNDDIDKEKEKKLIDFITSKYSKIKTIIKNINRKQTNVILGTENHVLYGDGYIFDELLGYKFKISNMSFYQVNPVQTEKLYSKAIEYADLSENDTILDLYCGIGTIGIIASKNAKKLYGIEIIADAIKDAKENAKINNIQNAEFFCGDAKNTLPELVKKINIDFEKLKKDESKIKKIEKKIANDFIIFVDPPRKGLDKITIETLLKIKAKKIVYISCNPATLARDLKLLNEKYDIKEITPFDMFPYTSHVECCSVLYLKDSI